VICGIAFAVTCIGATAMRSVCTWVSSVYGYLESDSDEERAAHEKRLQDAIDLDLKNTAELLDLIETTDTEFMVVSAAGNHTYFYGEDLPELLRKTHRIDHAIPSPQAPDRSRDSLARSARHQVAGRLGRVTSPQLYPNSSPTLIAMFVIRTLR
jgi:hypothetical protein